MIDNADRRTLIRLLGILQGHLESCIESCLIDGETEPRDPIDKPHVVRDRKHWREAEDIIKKLSGGK